MSGRAVFGIVLALVASLIFGIAIGEWYYRLFANAIPEALKAQTNMQGTHIMFVLRGLVVGGLAFVGSLIIAAAAPLFRAPKTKPTAGSAPTPTR